VLVIEDHVDAAESLQVLLECVGHTVAVAYTGATGIETARTFQPEVVLCDIGLPDGMDGYAVARALRSEPGLSRCRLVALTGYGRYQDRQRASEAGFDLHVVKPVDVSDLVSLLRPAGFAAEDAEVA
jgi:CheY-like chemotaxis protein